MRKIKTRIRFRFASIAVTAVILGVATQSAVNGQNDPGPFIDLETAVQTALDTHPGTRLADARIRETEANIVEAKNSRLPSVQFSQSFIRSNNPVFVFGSLLEQGRFRESDFALGSLNHPDSLSNFRTALETSVPIFDRGRTSSRVAQAVNARDQADYGSEAVRQQLRFDVVRSFYGVILAKSLAEVYREAVKAAEANLRKTRDMFEVGMTTKADYLAANVELANTRQQRLVADSDLTTARTELNLLLGSGMENLRSPAGSLREIFFPVEDLKELVSAALENRPDYMQAELEVEKSRLRSKSIKDEKLPEVEAFGKFGYSSPYIANGSSDYTVGVSLSLTLFDPGRRSRLEAAAAGVSAAGFRKEILADRIRMEVVRAYENYRTARERIQVSIKTVAQAEEALRITHDRYTSALATFDEVLRAEALLVRTKHDLLMSRYDYYVSYAAVQHATGRLTDVRAFQ